MPKASRPSFKMRKVLRKEQRPFSKGYPKLVDWDVLECGHACRTRAFESTAEAIQWLGVEFSGQPHRRRCYECAREQK